MRPVTQTKTLTAANASAVATAQTLASAGNFTLTASPVVLDASRRILFTFAANETGHTFTIYGTNHYGNPISETVAGNNGGTVATYFDYKTVTKGTGPATTGNVSIGTNTTGSGDWVAITPHLSTAELTVSCVVTGSVTYTVEYTYQDVNYNPNSNFAYSNDLPHVAVWPDPTVQGISANAVATVSDLPIWAARVTVNSGTGSVQATFLQTGIAGP